MKPKPAAAWTVEQYGLAGFSALYAEKLHLPRLAAARQITLWLLQSAPGVPADDALCWADLGAGTCAACLGTRMALHEHAGVEQPFRAYAVEVAASAARFSKAFTAMCAQRGTPPVSSTAAFSTAHGRRPLLPAQSAEQYVTIERPGIVALASALFAELRRRNARAPHLLITSFSLHYLRPHERDDVRGTLWLLEQRAYHFSRLCGP